MFRRMFLHMAAALSIAVTLPAVAVEPVLIGQSAPLSGINETLGSDIRDGALAYFNKVNAAGGVHGRKLELLSLDDGNEIERAQANTRELVEQRGVLALFGYSSATLSVPVLPIVERGKVAFFAPFTGADVLRQPHPYVYNHRAGYADELAKIVEHYTMLGMTRFAVLHYDDPVGHENLAAVERALGARRLQAIAAAPIKRDQTDVSREVTFIMKTNPQVVIATTRYSSTAEFVKLARSKGSAAQFVSTSFAGSNALAEALGENGVGMLMSQVVPTPSRVSVSVVKEFHEAIKNVAPEKRYSYTALESYIAAKALVEGLKRAGPNADRVSLVRALDGLANYDAGGYVINFASGKQRGSRYVTLTMLGRDRMFRD